MSACGLWVAISSYSSYRDIAKTNVVEEIHNVQVLEGLSRKVV